MYPYKEFRIQVIKVYPNARGQRVLKEYKLLNFGKQSFCIKTNR